MVKYFCGRKYASRQYTGSAPWQPQTPGKFLPVIARSEAAIRSPCGSTKPKSNTLGEYEKRDGFPLGKRSCPRGQLHVSACHCEERSDAAIRSPCGSTKPKSNPLGEYEKHYEVALSTTTLPGFSAETRIAAPVCALVRNDMQKLARCLRLQERGARWHLPHCHCEERSDGAIRSPAVGQNEKEIPSANTHLLRISPGTTFLQPQTPGRFLHVIARSEATRQSVLLAVAQNRKAILWAKYEKHYEVALSTTTLPGFSAGTRIATPVCALVRNDMQKLARCLRLQERCSQ